MNRLEWHEIAAFNSQNTTSKPRVEYDMLHKAFKVGGRRFVFWLKRSGGRCKMVRRQVTSVPADGYPEGRVTANARPGTKCFGTGRKSGHKDAKALMQAIPECSLVLSRH
jgi:hypothetical protein